VGKSRFGQGGFGVIRLSDLPISTLSTVLEFLADEVDVRLTDLQLSAFEFRGQCSDYEARLTAKREDGRGLLTFVRIDMEKLENADMAQALALVTEEVLKGIEDLNDSIENEPFPSPAPLIPRVR
jgi:hypothetical protein